MKENIRLDGDKMRDRPAMDYDVISLDDVSMGRLEAGQEPQVSIVYVRPVRCDHNYMRIRPCRARN
jgi:hypothetical protein